MDVSPSRIMDRGDLGDVKHLLDSVPPFCPDGMSKEMAAEQNCVLVAYGKGMNPLPPCAPGVKESSGSDHDCRIYD